MVTGQPPYTAETPLGVIVRHINDPIPSARALNPEIPPAVDALIQRGMAKNPAARPQTAGEFAQLLSQALEAPSLVAPPPTLLSPPPAVPAPRRPRLLWAVIGLVALCVLGVFALGSAGALLAIFNAPRNTPTPLASLTPISLATPTVPPTPLGQILSANFADSLGGFRISKVDATGGIAYDGGALRFSLLKSGVEWFSTSGRVAAQDVKIEVDTQQTAGPPQTEFGAICRWQNADNFTAFGISAGGQFKIWQKLNGASLRLIDWTDAPSLAGAGLAPHHLTITCSGAQLTLAVDGAQLGQTEDPGPVAGDVALFAGLRDTGQMVVDFTKVVVAQP